MIPPDTAAPSPFPENAEALMRDFAAATGADGVTLWRAEETELVAIANPLEPSIVGLRQPLDRGLISQVYLTGRNSGPGCKTETFVSRALCQ